MSQNKSENENATFRCSATGANVTFWWLRDSNNKSMDIRFIDALKNQRDIEQTVENGLVVSTLEIMLVKSIGILNESHIYCQAFWSEGLIKVNSKEVDLLIQGVWKSGSIPK